MKTLSTEKYLSKVAEQVQKIIGASMYAWDDCARVFPMGKPLCHYFDADYEQSESTLLFGESFFVYLSGLRQASAKAFLNIERLTYRWVATECVKAGIQITHVSPASANAQFVNNLFHYQIKVFSALSEVESDLIARTKEVHGSLNDSCYHSPVRDDVENGSFIDRTEDFRKETINILDDMLSYVLSFQGNSSGFHAWKFTLPCVDDSDSDDSDSCINNKPVQKSKRGYFNYRGHYYSVPIGVLNDMLAFLVSSTDALDPCSHGALKLARKPKGFAEF